MHHIWASGLLALGLVTHAVLNSPGTSQKEQAQIQRDVPPELSRSSQFNELLVAVEQKTIRLVDAFEPEFEANVAWMLNLLKEPVKHNPADMFALSNASNKLLDASNQPPTSSTSPSNTEPSLRHLNARVPAAMTAPVLHPTVKEQQPSPPQQPQPTAVAEGSGYSLAYALEHSTGSPDYKRAVQLYYLSAQKGDVRSQSRLGLAYMTGQLGLIQNFERAEKWLTEAAIQESPDAQYLLGRLLLKQHPTQVADARVWISLAAKNGYVPAQSMLKAYASNSTTQ